MSSDYDKQQWQAEQAARNTAIDKQRQKERKTRERAARNARRKLERLHKTLSDKGEITDFENEFGESVVERLDKFGSAFQDREKGRPGDALSFAQKRVVAAMNKKVKDLKKKPSETDNPDSDYERRSASSHRHRYFYKRRRQNRKLVSLRPIPRGLEEDWFKVSLRVAARVLLRECLSFQALLSPSLTFHLSVTRWWVVLALESPE